MLRKLKEAGLIWPTTAALLALCVLLALGAWQLQRKAWKDDLIAKIAAGTQAAPLDIRQAAYEWHPNGRAEYLRVRVRGRFQHEGEQYVYAPGPRGPGYHVYTPLILDSPQDSGRLLLVNRGYVAAALKDPASRPQSLVTESVEIIGLLRGPEYGNAFTPEPDLAKRVWYKRDIDGMLEALREEWKGGRAFPFSVDAEAGPDPAELPRGGVTRLDLPNRHLEYAITWYGLALTLIGVYLAFAASRLGLFSGHR